jgi:lysophospholipase L1-like esterase
MRAYPEWVVLNRGVNGERSDQIAARFERDVVATAPAAVIIIGGVNDVYQGRSAAHVETHLQQMYERALQAGIRAVAGTIVPYNTATRDQNARMAEINAWIRHYAEAGTIGFVDTRSAVASPDDANRLFESPDGLHPTALGYRRMAESIAPVLAQLGR